MKKRIPLLLVVVPMLLLASCQGTIDLRSSSSDSGAPTTSGSSFTPVDPQVAVRSFPFYIASAAVQNADGNIDLSKQQDGKCDLVFLSGQDYVPYFGVSSFVKMFGDVASYITKETDDGKTYSITFARDGKIFSFTLDSATKTMTIVGGYSDILEPSSQPEDNSSNLIEGRQTFRNIGDSKASYTLNYQDTELSTFSYRGSMYAPLSLLDTVFFKQTMRGHFFAYDRLYQYDNPLLLSKLKFVDKVGDEPYTLHDKMASVIADTAMPMYLRRYNRDIITFLFENYYGLKYSLGIQSMAKYFQSTSYYADLLSDSPKTRGDALSYFITRLQDGHTNLLSPAVSWGEEYTVSVPQSLQATREGIEDALKAAREAAYKEAGLKTNQVRYSQDGETAVFPLTKFACYEDYLDPTTKQPKVSIEQAMASDTYLQSKAYFEEIEKKGGVKSVIIDMSINDGGNSGTMANLLALISRDNKSMVYFHHMPSNNVTTIETHLDMNRDGKVDEKDVTYGNKFNIYLLVSPCAFSCGTAYPFYAWTQGMATIIGQKPGGGECALDLGVLPNGQIITHSGNLRIASPVQGGYIYDEAGPDISIELKYTDFYNLELIQTLIKNPNQ